jgi:hypothetical protein
MWADHRVRACTVAPYEMRHPLVGSLTVVQQTLSNGSGPTVVVATTEAGSASRAALTLLAQAVVRDTVQDSVQDSVQDAVPAGPTRTKSRAGAGAGADVDTGAG